MYISQKKLSLTLTRGSAYLRSLYVHPPDTSAYLMLELYPVSNSSMLVIDCHARMKKNLSIYISLKLRYVLDAWRNYSKQDFNASSVAKTHKGINSIMS